MDTNSDSLPARAKKKKRASRNPKSHLALVKELSSVSGTLVRHGVFGFTSKFGRALIKDSGLDPIWHEERFFEVLGDALLALFDALGPMYGKAGQVALSRLASPLKEIAQRIGLGRLYDSWPPLPFHEIEAILDDEVPSWHERLQVDPYPIGVASMAQVHRATDEHGREWAIKIIKPKSKKRLGESLAAVHQVITILKPMAMTDTARRALREVDELSKSMAREVDLEQEKQHIDKMRERLATKKLDILRIPATYNEFCTPRVLTIELFKGVPLSKVVGREVELDPVARKKLAKKVLSELLIQVFELGLFHGDPHAGNLILLNDGSVGLFDWGLQGELLESDRHHIAAILKAVVGMNLDQLAHALVELARAANSNVEHEDVLKELSKLARLIKHHSAAGTKPSMNELMEASLKAADRLAIPLPMGLLLMVKTLLTIEGLARGIDPDISFLRAASPVLLRAARPGLGDLFNIAKNIPKLALKMFS